MTRTTKGAGRPRKHPKYPPATVARGATPELVARALLRREKPVRQTQEPAKRNR